MGPGTLAPSTVSRSGAQCIACRNPVSVSYLRDEGQQGRIKDVLMAVVVADGRRGRTYMSPPKEAVPDLPEDIDTRFLDSEMPENPRWFSPPGYGFKRYRDLFTRRQLLALTTLMGLVREVIEVVKADAIDSGWHQEDDRPLEEGGAGPRAYAESIAVYLGLGVSKWADLSNTICSWNTTNQNISHLFTRQAIPMAWDFVEVNPVGTLASVNSAIESIAAALGQLVCDIPGTAEQRDATADINFATPITISTDPPYYDNIGYADLSDFFYIWLRSSLKEIAPDLFSTLLTPKTQELIASPFRFDGDRVEANAHFETGLRQAFKRMHEAQDVRFPLTVFYAFKQSESEETGSVSTGWETMLEGLLGAGFVVNGTWPMRTERGKRSVARDTAALASSIILVCRPRQMDAPLATRKSVLEALKTELPTALRHLQQGNIAPVDLAQAAIGPGIGVFSRFAKVVEADGSAMSVRTALALINDVLDETLSEQEGDFDADTRWAIAWFEQSGMSPGPFGDAETLSKAKNTAVNALVAAEIVESKSGTVRLLDRTELSKTWDPAAVGVNLSETDFSLI
jgi:putative DNA methylase